MDKWWPSILDTTPCDTVPCITNSRTLMINPPYKIILRFLKPHSLHSMLRLCHGKIPKVVSSRFTTLNWWRGDDKVCPVNVHQLSNLGRIGLKGYVQDCRSLGRVELIMVSNRRRGSLVEVEGRGGGGLTNRGIY